MTQLQVAGVIWIPERKSGWTLLGIWPEWHCLEDMSVATAAGIHVSWGQEVARGLSAAAVNAGQ